MAGLLAPPGYQWRDNNGNPLSGGYIYTYYAGTTTEAFSYKTQESAARHTNPVRLDLEGRADVWLDSGISYKILIKDSNGNTISTTDTVSGVGGIASSGITLTANLDTNNYDIISNPGSNIRIIPHGTGKTNVYDLVSKDNLTLDYNLAFNDNDGFVETSTLNEVLIFNSPASAVNYTQLDSAETAVNPKITAKGDDTNVGLEIQPKGTGVVNVKGTAASSSELRLSEDTDNGTNYIGLKAPTSVASNLTFTLPSADGSANQVIKTDGSATLGFQNEARLEYLGEFSSSSNVDITSVITSTYDVYHLAFTGDGTTGVGYPVYMYVSTDNGSTWQNTGYYSCTMGPAGSYQQQTNDNSAIVSYSGGFDRSYVSPGRMVLYYPSTSGKKTFWTMQHCEITATDITKTAGGFWNSTTAVNALRFSFGFGNPNVEYIKVWGMKSS